MTAAEALRLAVPKLAAAGVEDAARDARLLLAHAMHLAPQRITLHLHDTLTPDMCRRFEVAIEARAQRQPLSQIIGHREFWGRPFHVTRDVLDPRPETEALVMAALEEPFRHVLDLGTGTGAILLSLLAERTEATGLGTDLSPEALLVAVENAERLGCAERARFIRADWFSGIEGRFDLIVSNPPYIAEAEVAHLAPEVRDWEPHLALTPGGDGIGAYRQIVAGAPLQLEAQGRLIMEIGPTQAESVCQLLSDAGFVEIQVSQDMDGRDRVVSARVCSEGTTTNVRDSRHSTPKNLID